MIWAAIWLGIFDAVSDDVCVPEWVYITFVACGLIRLIVLDSSGR